jgi:integrase
MGGNNSGRKRRFGSARKLASGRWQARYTGPDGLVRRAPQTFETKRDAEDWLVETEAEILRDEWLDPDAGMVPLGNYAQRWIAERRLEERTVELYSGLLRNHIAPMLGDVALVEVTPARVRTWHAALLKTTGESTVAKAYSLLRAVLNTAVDDELIRRNACRIRGAGQARTPERPTATFAEVFAIAAKIQRRYRVLVLLATFGQLRFGELMGLRRADLQLPETDDDAPVLTVRKSIAQLNSGAQRVKNPKSDAGARRVILPAAILPDLRVHMDTYAEPGADGRVFVGPKGGTPRRSNFNRIWKRAVREAGANPELHLHDLRHTGGTLAAQTGATLRELMTRLGHSTPRAALIYQHATGERDKKIADGLNLMIEGRLTVPSPESLDGTSGTRPAA